MPDRGTDQVAAAMLGSAVVIAHQVAAKAARDALFLSTFPVTSLPVMMIGAAVLAILMMLLASRAMSATGPARLLPCVFWASGALHAAEWLLVYRFKGAVAIVFYLHFAGLGAVLISGFWTVVSECFDPHTARQRMGRIVGAGSLGGLAGGLLAERIAALWTAPFILPVLAFLHLLAGCAAGMLCPPARGAAASRARGGLGEGARLLARFPYLRHLALLVFLGTASAAMIDYVFKAQLQQATAYSQEALQRFCAVFYTAASLGGFLLETVAARFALANTGLGATVSTLPAAVVLGSAGAWVFPGLGSATAARALEYVVRNSLFRSGYELFYTPVLPAEKRPVKPLIDVGLDRLGDLLGGAVIRLLLWLIPGTAPAAMLGTAAGAGLLGIWCARRLDRGYVGALEKSLRTRAVELDLTQVQDKTTCTTLARIILPSGPESAPREPAPRPLDPGLRRIRDLQSGSAERVRRVLREDVVTHGLAAHVIPLLAWDEVAGDVLAALRRAAPAIAGQLVDTMLDPGQAFAVRRRIPGALSGVASPRAVEGLARGLQDQRFEVRYRCAKALAAILRENPELAPPETVIFDAVAKELELDRFVWQSHRLLDGDEEDALLAGRAGRGLEHVFTLLSLVLPREPVRIAFRALHTGDGLLRGTALEYLESVLPRPLHERLWPLLEAWRSPGRPARGSEEILAELLRSRESIEVKAAERPEDTAAGG